jgi:regulator of protease activity HflC (stomatin/prohibitin superfamily)
VGVTFLVIGLIFVLAAIITFVSGSRIRPPQDDYGRTRGSSARSGAFALGGILLIIGASTILLDSFTTIGARNVGVQTAFGKVRDNVFGPGFHWVKPWHDVDEFDGSRQTLHFYHNEKKDDGDCITVRLGNSTTACVDVTAQWNIAHHGANGDAAVKDLYLQYKTFDNVRTNLVIRQLQSALNEVFGTYDPLAAISSDKDVPAVTTEQLQGQVLADLARDLGTAITVDSVTIPIVHFDTDTENRLKAFQQAKADTRIAAQQEQTAFNQAAANKALADQPSIHDSGVQYQNCLNLIANLAKQGQLGGLPQTFNCNQGSGSAGVIIQK